MGGVYYWVSYLSVFVVWRLGYVPCVIGCGTGHCALSEVSDFGSGLLQIYVLFCRAVSWLPPCLVVG